MSQVSKIAFWRCSLNIVASLLCNSFTLSFVIVWKGKDIYLTMHLIWLTLFDNAQLHSPDILTKKKLFRTYEFLEKCLPAFLCEFRIGSSKSSGRLGSFGGAFEDFSGEIIPVLATYIRHFHSAFLPSSLSILLQISWGNEMKSGFSL